MLTGRIRSERPSFEDKGAAENAVDLNPPQPPVDAPVQLAGIEIHEVLATA
jgi:hypothetical protein